MTKYLPCVQWLLPFFSSNHASCNSMCRSLTVNIARLFTALALRARMISTPNQKHTKESAYAVSIRLWAAKANAVLIYNKKIKTLSSQGFRNAWLSQFDWLIYEKDSTTMNSCLHKCQSPLRLVIQLNVSVLTACMYCVWAWGGMCVVCAPAPHQFWMFWRG